MLSEMRQTSGRLPVDKVGTTLRLELEEDSTWHLQLSLPIQLLLEATEFLPQLMEDRS